MDSWAVVLLVTAAALLLRRQGDSWPITIAKLVLFVALSVVAAALLGAFLVWRS